MKAKRIIIAAAVIALALAVVICCLPSQRAAVMFRSGRDEVIAGARDILRDHGIDYTDVFMEKTYVDKSMTHTYRLVAVLNDSPEYEELYDILSEMDKLHFKESGSTRNPYVFTCECRIGNSNYSIYGNALEENGDSVYPETEAYSSAANKAGEETTKKYSVNSTGRQSTYESEEPYGIKDYVTPDDFYDDYCDDFESYEEAEDYYDEYN